MVTTVSAQDFDKEVLRSPEPVLVAFRASWCVPSQELAPAVEEIDQELDGRVKTVVVDFDRDDKICRRFGVTRVPVTMLIADGKVQDFIGGWTDKKVIREMVDRHTAQVVQVGAHNFEREVLSSPVPTLVHFDAAWCQASQQLLPILDEVSERFRGKARVVRMEFGGENAALCARYGIVRVPTMALFVNGKIEDQILGAMVGGTKRGDVRASCVALTSEQNVSQMLERFVA
jgi:thioredoxin-like negative regulator of GroEL